MRTVVLLCLLTAGGMVFGWPSPWVIVCSAFVIGFLARRPAGAPVESERPGYLIPPALPESFASLESRVGAYTDASPLPPEAFGLPLERPAFGDCEGCGGS